MVLQTKVCMPQSPGLQCVCVCVCVYVCVCVCVASSPLSGTHQDPAPLLAGTACKQKDASFIMCVLNATSKKIVCA